MTARTALFAAALVGCIFVTDSAALTVHNHSTHAVVELRIAETHDLDWGGNLVGRTMWPGDDVVIHDIWCGHYDVLAVDSHGADCMLADVHICGADQAWVISDLCW